MIKKNILTRLALALFSCSMVSSLQAASWTDRIRENKNYLEKNTNSLLSSYFKCAFGINQRFQPNLRILLPMHISTSGIKNTFIFSELGGLYSIKHEKKDTSSVWINLCTRINLNDIFMLGFHAGMKGCLSKEAQACLGLELLAEYFSLNINGYSKSLLNKKSNSLTSGLNINALLPIPLYPQLALELGIECASDATRSSQKVSPLETLYSGVGALKWQPISACRFSVGARYKNTQDGSRQVEALVLIELRYCIGHLLAEQLSSKQAGFALSCRRTDLLNTSIGDWQYEKLAPKDAQILSSEPNQLPTEHLNVTAACSDIDHDKSADKTRYLDAENKLDLLGLKEELSPTLSDEKVVCDILVEQPALTIDPIFNKKQSFKHLFRGLDLKKAADRNGGEDDETVCSQSLETEQAETLLGIGLSNSVQGVRIDQDTLSIDEQTAVRKRSIDIDHNMDLPGFKKESSPTLPNQHARHEPLAAQKVVDLGISVDKDRLSNDSFKGLQATEIGNRNRSEGYETLHPQTLRLEPPRPLSKVEDKESTQQAGHIGLDGLSIPDQNEIVKGMLDIDHKLKSPDSKKELPPPLGFEQGIRGSSVPQQVIASDFMVEQDRLLNNAFKDLGVEEVGNRSQLGGDETALPQLVREAPFEPLVDIKRKEATQEEEALTSKYPAVEDTGDAVKTKDSNCTQAVKKNRAEEKKENQEKHIDKQQLEKLTEKYKVVYENVLGRKDLESIQNYLGYLSEVDLSKLDLPACEEQIERGGELLLKTNQALNVENPNKLKLMDCKKGCAEEISEVNKYLGGSKKDFDKYIQSAECFLEASYSKDEKKEYEYIEKLQKKIQFKIEELVSKKEILIRIKDSEERLTYNLRKLGECSETFKKLLESLGEREIKIFNSSINKEQLENIIPLLSDEANLEECIKKLKDFNKKIRLDEDPSWNHDKKLSFSLKYPEQKFYSLFEKPSLEDFSPKLSIVDEEENNIIEIDNPASFNIGDFLYSKLRGFKRELPKIKKEFKDLSNRYLSSKDRDEREEIAQEVRWLLRSFFSIPTHMCEED